jgi:hypothetical protein
MKSNHSQIDCEAGSFRNNDIVYRGMTLSEYALNNYRDMRRLPFSWGGFISTTKSRFISEGFLEHNLKEG